VLVPIALVDTLLRVAEKGLYRPLWSDRILGEAQAASRQPVRDSPSDAHPVPAPLDQWSKPLGRPLEARRNPYLDAVP
jgi:hypothetical protein